MKDQATQQRIKLILGIVFLILGIANLALRPDSFLIPAMFLIASAFFSLSFFRKYWTSNGSEENEN